MTNMQLLLTIGIPGILVLLSWQQASARVNDLSKSLNNRIDSFEQAMIRQFGEVNRQFGEVNRRLELIGGDQKQFFAVTGKLDGRIDEIAKR